MYVVCAYGREKQEEHVCEDSTQQYVSSCYKCHGEDIWTSLLRVMGGGAARGRDTRIERLIGDEKQLALGLVNSQRGSPSTLMIKDCTAWGIKKLLSECVFVCFLTGYSSACSTLA